MMIANIAIQRPDNVRFVVVKTTAIAPVTIPAIVVTGQQKISERIKEVIASRLTVRGWVNSSDSEGLANVITSAEYQASPNHPLEGISSAARFASDPVQGVW